ncbi:MAG TPA: hypothetical protein VGZ93_01080 [Candidatus Methylacidiphilales bacterium]|jgi:hypothetical protein|nr:hypothetical protein [Candidatus Methylacidiphilales bacterium]
MSITTTVEEGKIVLPPGVDWPNGTVVWIEQVKQEAKPRNLRELLKDYEGIADDLPADMAENHNHYIHGHPKQ